MAQATAYWIRRIGGAALLLLAGCHSFALPPLYEQDFEPQPTREGHRRVEWDFEVGLRPLFQVKAKEEEDRIEAHLFFPLGYMERTPEERTIRLYPFYQRIVRTDADGFKDDDTIVFPFLFTGNHPVEGSYLYLFPLGGTLKGLLTKDEAVGVLFPLYAWTRDRDVETHHVLWPLISYTSGGGSSGFRFLPFFSHQEKRRPNGDLVFNRTSILWPLISWADERRNSRNPYTSFFLFPLFGWIRSEWRDDNTILWPLFRWWHDKRTGYKEYRVPFPFFVYGSGPKESRLDLWPLIGFREREGYSRHFFLWPIERYEYRETSEYKDYRLWILPLFWTHHREYKRRLPGATHQDDRMTTLWPLVRYERRRDGFFEIRILAPLWFKDPMLNFETILAPLFHLFRHTEDTQGYTRTDLLFGLWSSRSSPRGSSRWDILGGLIGYTSTPKGGRTRLLWFLEF